jgi:uncharacterized protein YjbI with pentapeptide repeats
VLRLLGRSYNFASVTAGLTSALILAGILIGTTDNLDFLVDSVRSVEVLHVRLQVPLSISFPVISGLVFLAGFAFVAFIANRDNIESHWLFAFLLIISYPLVLAAEFLLMTDFMKGQFEAELDVVRIFAIVSSLTVLLAAGRSGLPLGPKLLLTTVFAPLFLAGTTVFVLFVAATPVETHEFERLPGKTAIRDWSQIRELRTLVFDRFPPVEKGVPTRRYPLFARTLSLRDVDNTVLSNALDQIGRNLAVRNLAGLDAAGSSLDRVNFYFANLTGAYFAEANVAHSLFIKSHLALADFARANVTAATFVGAEMDGTSFTSAAAPAANFEEVHARLTSFEESDLRFADFKGAELSGASFEGAKLAGVTFSGADLLGANLSQFLHDSAFDGTSFVRAKLWRVNPFGSIGPTSDNVVSQLALRLNLEDANLGFESTTSNGRDQAARDVVRLFMPIAEQLLTDKKDFDEIRKKMNFIAIGPDFLFDMSGHMPGNSAYLDPFGGYLPSSIEGVLRHGGTGMPGFGSSAEFNEANVYQAMYRDFRIWQALAARGNRVAYDRAFNHASHEFACRPGGLPKDLVDRFLARLLWEEVGITIDYDAAIAKHAGSNAFGHAEKSDRARVALSSYESMLALFQDLSGQNCLGPVPALSDAIKSLKGTIEVEKTRIGRL